MLSSDALVDNLRWEDSIDRFGSATSTKVRNVISNIQRLHDCKESRDSHFLRNRDNVAPSSEGRVFFPALNHIKVADTNRPADVNQLFEQLLERSAHVRASVNSAMLRIEID